MTLYVFRSMDKFTYLFDEIIAKYDNVESVHRDCNAYVAHQQGSEPEASIYIEITGDIYVELRAEPYPGKDDYPF